MILGRLLPTHFPAPPQPLYSLSTWGLCANSSWSLLSAFPPPLSPLLLLSSPMPPKWLIHLRSCLSPQVI